MFCFAVSCSVALWFCVFFFDILGMSYTSCFCAVTVDPRDRIGAEVKRRMRLASATWFIVFDVVLSFLFSDSFPFVLEGNSPASMLGSSDGTIPRGRLHHAQRAQSQSTSYPAMRRTLKDKGFASF